MKDGGIDYSKYTLRELEEALAGINKQQYPINYANLRSAYELLTSTLPTESKTEHSAAIKDIQEDKPQPKYDEYGRYLPNQIPRGELASHIILSPLLLAYGTYGVWANDLYMPGRRSRGIHLHDSPAWVMYGAILCACLVMLSVVADHYDRRNNETSYRFFAALFTGIGWTLFVLSLLFDFVRKG
jgi:hypothetical protein